MAEERIDIKVTDSGSDKAAKGLRAIASEAVKAQRAVDQVSANLSKLPVTQLNALANMANKAAIAAAKMATEEQRAARAIEMTRAATERANAATYAAQAAKARLEAAEMRLATARDKAAASAAKEAAATNTATTATNLNAAANVRATKNSKAMTQATLNLSRQFADVGVTAAMGMSPLMIMIQQGPQIADAFQMAKTQGLGFSTVLKGMFGQVATLAAVMAPLAIVAGAVGTAFYGMHKKMSDSYPKDITEGMGLTADQLKEVEDRAVTFGDTVAGVMQTLGEDIRNGPLGTFASWFAEESAVAATAFFENFRWGIAGVVAMSKAGSATISDNFAIAAQNMARNMPNAYDFVSKAMVKFVEFQLRGIRAIITALNLIPGVDIKLPEIVAPDARQLAAAGTFSAKTFAESFRDELQSEIESQNDFIARSTQNAIENARKRAREQAGDAGAGRTRTGRTGRTPEETRAEALRRVNAQLDNEIKNMGMLKREREAAQRFDQIEEQLLRQRIVLLPEETKAIKDKIAQVQRLAEVQSEMDRIYDDINGATERYTVTMDALDKMLAKEAITYEEYIKQVNKANDAHTEALDPLHSITDAHDAAMRAAKAYGAEVQRVTHYEQVREALRKKDGTILNATYRQGQDPRADAAMGDFDALQRQQQANSVIGSVIDPMKEKEMMLANEQFYYDELKRLRENNYLNEEQYALASAQLDRKYQDIKLQNTMDFFGALAGLSSSSNRELAAIGKAAAITQATVNTFLAISNAMRVPFPANLPLIAQATAQGASLLSQIQSVSVGNFATGGQIMVGGRDGVDKNNINMNVTKGERVTIETPAQQKATDEALANGQSGGGANVNVSNINVVDPRFVIDSMDTAAGSRVITNIITANKREINAILGSR